MTPEERKAKNRMWRDLWALAEAWEGHYPAPSAAACARQMKDILRPYKPADPGRPPKWKTAP